LTSRDTFELSYRDEFVIKSIVSDDLLEEAFSIDVEGLGDRNDFRKLLKGIELVDKIVMAQKSNLQTNVISDYHINVMYRDSLLARISYEVVITPQDGSGLLKIQKISDCKWTISRKPLPSMARIPRCEKCWRLSILVRVKTEEAITQYQEVLVRKPDDAAAMSELLKSYLNKKDYDQVVKTGKLLLKMNPHDAAAFANIAFAFGKLNQWIARLRIIKRH